MSIGLFKGLALFSLRLMPYASRGVKFHAIFLTQQHDIASMVCHVLLPCAFACPGRFCVYTEDVCFDRFVFPTYWDAFVSKIYVWAWCSSFRLACAGRCSVNFVGFDVVLLCLQDDFVSIICGYTCVTPTFQPLEGAAPIPAAFVGEIQYEIEWDHRARGSATPGWTSIATCYLYQTSNEACMNCGFGGRLLRSQEFWSSENENHQTSAYEWSARKTAKSIIDRYS